MECLSNVYVPTREVMLFTRPQSPGLHPVPRVSAQVAAAALRPLSQERMRELNVVMRSGGSSSEEGKEEVAVEAPGLRRLGEAEDDAPILSLDKLGL